MKTIRRCNNCGTILKEIKDSIYNTYSFFCNRCDVRQSYWIIK